MKRLAFVTSIEMGTEGEIIDHPVYFADALSALDYLKDAVKSRGIRLSNGDLSIDALVERYQKLGNVLKSIGRCKKSCLGWTKDTRLVWVCIERIELKGGC